MKSAHHLLHLLENIYADLVKFGKEGTPQEKAAKQQDDEYWKQRNIQDGTAEVPYVKEMKNMAEQIRQLRDQVKKVMPTGGKNGDIKKDRHRFARSMGDKFSFSGRLTKVMKGIQNDQMIQDKQRWVEMITLAAHAYRHLDGSSESLETLNRMLNGGGSDDSSGDALGSGYLSSGGGGGAPPAAQTMSRTM